MIGERTGRSGAIAAHRLQRPGPARVARAAPPSESGAREPAWRAGSPSAPTRRRCGDEVPLLYETGGDERFDAVVVITAPRVRRPAGRRPTREQRLLPDEEKVAARGLRLRERRDAGRARRLRRRRARQSSRDEAAARSSSLAGGAAPDLRDPPVAKPGWWERLWYPLRYGQIVRGHAHNYELDPALLAAVIYQESKFKADARSKSGAIGLMQLLPDTARGSRSTPVARSSGSRISTTPRSTCATAPGTSGTYAEVRRRADALAAYNAGQRNVDRWRRPERASNSRRPAPTSRASNSSSGSTAGPTAPSSAA